MHVHCAGGQRGGWAELVGGGTSGEKHGRSGHKPIPGFVPECYVTAHRRQKQFESAAAISIFMSPKSKKNLSLSLRSQRDAAISPVQ